MDYTKEVMEEAAKSLAQKRKVGAILVHPQYGIVGRGHNYNSDPNNMFCEDVNGNTLDSVIHAEAACISDFFHGIALDEEKIKLNKCTMYVSHQPCQECVDQLARHGVSQIHIVPTFMKFDTSKLRYDLVPPSATKALAEVLTYGAKKYKPNNWKQVDDPERYIAALYRHLEAWRSGEERDEESNLQHLAHAITNVAFLLELKYIPKSWAPDSSQI